ncbi:MAG: BMP family ABC transporter substrate-binding protein [Oscillospiraceae bacterium]|nr:BMP family ABC transporter substrate-binding protein [Oscillospiraceae bacterium]
MKKLITLLLVLALMLPLWACGDNKDLGNGHKIAMVTGYGDINDQSFNQATWEAIERFNGDYDSHIQYYMPTSDDSAARIAAAERAIADGYDTIVVPGYVHGATVAELSEQYPEVRFIALDVSKADLLSAALEMKGQTYDNVPENWDLNSIMHMDNVYSAVFCEEIPGYMAGYAAVKLGYRSLGYLGGMAVPAVVRYGYGFVQGAEAAAEELGVTVEMKYAYGNQFVGDSDITAAMDTWYQGGTEIVFSCGAGIWTSVAEAAKKANGKMIGVDVDQQATIDGMYGEGLTLSSAMKSLATATYDTLVDILEKGNWSNYAGQIHALGLISENPEENYVGLSSTTLFEEGKFSREDYADLTARLYRGELAVSSDNTQQPATKHVSVQWLGNLK